MDKKVYIKNKFIEFGITLSDRQVAQFEDYASLLVEWNSFMNLTAITDFEEIVEKHFIDSLALSLMDDVSRETSGKSMIDVGTGAGFPGIPLKIVYPELEVTLLDSLNKRIKFLNEVITKLELKGITAIHGRAEEAARKHELREQFDLCVSRAVANLSTLNEYCLPFIKKGGKFISYKSGEVDEELDTATKAIKILGGKVIDKKFFALPGTDIQLSLIIINKVKETPKTSPRKAGTPSKQPL